MIYRETKHCCGILRCLGCYSSSLTVSWWAMRYQGKSEMVCVGKLGENRFRARYDWEERVEWRCSVELGCFEMYSTFKYFRLYKRVVWSPENQYLVLTCFLLHAVDDYLDTCSMSFFSYRRLTYFLSLSVCRLPYKRA